MARVCERLLAAVLFVVFSPIFAAAWLRRSLLFGEDALRVIRCAHGRGRPGTFARLSLRPLPGPRGALEHLLTEAVPGLPAVALGHMGLVGAPGRTPQEAQALPPRWREAYLSWRPGLVCEGSDDGGHPDRAHFEEVLTVEVYDASERRALLLRYAGAAAAEAGIALRRAPAGAPAGRHGGAQVS